MTIACTIAKKIIDIETARHRVFRKGVEYYIWHKDICLQTCARSHRRIQSIYIQTDIKRVIPHLLPDFCHYRLHTAVITMTCRDHTESLKKQENTVSLLVLLIFTCLNQMYAVNVVWRENFYKFLKNQENSIRLRCFCVVVCIKKYVINLVWWENF